MRAGPWRWSLAGAVLAAVVLLIPSAAWASHRIDGTPHWTIPWYATAVLMAVPYVAVAVVAVVVYRLLRREFRG
ncbi:MAG TPA: hypothetical protein VF282_02335 [Bacillota bacterium]